MEGLNAFIARGVTRADASDAARVGRFTYLCEVCADWYQWNGAHKATYFASPGDAIAAAALCKGPWFNCPDPGTVEAVPV